MIILLHRGELSSLYFLLKKFAASEKVIVLAAKEKITTNCAVFLDKICTLVYKIEIVERYDNSSVIEEKIYQLNKKHKIHTVFAAAEFDLYRAERIKKWLGLDYVPCALLEKFRNKIKMKDYFSRHGIKTSKYAEVKSVLDIYAFAEQYKFPIVVKQQAGGGGVGTKILNNMEDISAFAHENFRLNGFSEPELMVETYTHGKLYHVDGFSYHNEILYLSSGAYMLMG